MNKFDQRKIEDKLNNYIWNKLFITAKEKKFLSNILRYTDIIVFGGVIREFVLNNLKQIDHRDVDLVVVNLNDSIEELLKPFLIRKNSFGGYKLRIDQKDIDLWKFSETWGIKNSFPLFYSMTDFLPHTSFFNINAIAFSLVNKKLIYSESFKKFLLDRVLDIEFIPNPIPSLCLIKTYEYVLRYKLELSSKLINYMIENFETIKKDEIHDLQIKHYGSVKFSQKEILDFYNKIRESALRHSSILVAQ